MKEVILLIIVIPVVLWTFYSNYSKNESNKEDDLGARENPAPIGKTVYYDGYIKNLLSKDTNTLSLRLTVTDVIRGDEANKLVENASTWNRLPAEGEEYVLAKIQIKVVKLTDSKKYTVSVYDFDFTTKEGSVLDRASVSGLKPELSDIYEGGLTEGYLCCIVPIGTPLLLSWENGERWFSLESIETETSETETTSSHTEEESDDSTETTSEEIKDVIDV